MIGPVSSTPIRLAPQPHWKTATIRPKAAPIESRFITTAFSGTSTERKTIISSSAESRTTTPMKSGSFSAIASPKSSKIALMPPTWSWAPVLRLDRRDHVVADVVEQFGRLLALRRGRRVDLEDAGVLRPG